jgi:hypothetical protein
MLDELRHIVLVFFIPPYSFRVIQYLASLNVPVAHGNLTIADERSVPCSVGVLVVNVLVQEHTICAMGCTKKEQGLLVRGR